MIKQITEAWETAKSQLAQLKESVEMATAMANLKVQSNFLGRDKDKALRDFGDAVWSQVKGGKLSLPATFAASIKAMQDVEKRLEAQNNEINALIGEGGDILRAKATKSPKTAVAAKSKKR